MKSGERIELRLENAINSREKGGSESLKEVLETGEEYAGVKRQAEKPCSPQRWTPHDCEDRRQTSSTQHRRTASTALACAREAFPNKQSWRGSRRVPDTHITAL